jgi:hypothetical protein
VTLFGIGLSFEGPGFLKGDLRVFSLNNGGICGRIRLNNRGVLRVFKGCIRSVYGVFLGILRSCGHGRFFVGIRQVC